MRRWAWRLVALLALVVAAGAAYNFWLRDSGLVAVDTVTVEGVDSETAAGDQIRLALIEAGQGMSTLAPEPDRLRAAVADFPEVREVSADASFPSSLTVRVEMRRPVARVGEGEDAVGIAGDGTVLPDAAVTELDIPGMALNEPPESGTLAGPALEQAQVLGAAPPELLAVAESTVAGEADGPVVILDGGIELRFGDSSRAAEKWQAVSVVLTDPELELLDYVDLSSPGRPAVGGEGHQLPPVAP